MRLLIAVYEFVNLLFTVPNMAVTYHYHSIYLGKDITWHHWKWASIENQFSFYIYKDHLRLLSIALLEDFCLIITFSRFSIIGSACLFAVLEFLYVLATSIPSQERIKQSLNNLIAIPRSIWYQMLWSYIIFMILLNIIINLFEISTWLIKD